MITINKIFSTSTMNNIPCTYIDFFLNIVSFREGVLQNRRGASKKKSR